MTPATDAVPPVRLGVIGCGRIAQAAHLPAIAKTDAVALEAVSDPSPALADGVGARYGVRAFTSTDALLETDVEAVLIATPDRFHHELGRAALEAGKHVLMEKPLAATVAEAEDLAALATASGLRLQTGAMKRHDPGIAFAHRHLAAVEPIVSFAYWYRIPAERPAIEATMFPAGLVVDPAVRAHEDGLKAQSHRAAYLLATHGAHVFDQLLHFCGVPTWISVVSAQVGADYTWHGTVGLSSGGLGSFEITVDVHGDQDEGFDLYGPGGHIHARTPSPFWKTASEVEVFLERDGVGLRPHPRDTNAYKLQVADFARAVRAGGGENPSPAAGVDAVRLIHASAASVARGGERVAP